MEKITLTIKEACMVSDKLKSLGFSYGQIQKLFKNKDVRINNEKIKEDCLLSPDDTLTIFCEKLPSTEIEKVYEDENILIINKPFGIEVEGENGIAKKFNALAVHRLDRNTTGLLVLAKNKDAEESLLDAFKNKKIIKKYYAEVAGKAEYKDFNFSAYLVKDNNLGQVKIYEKPIKNSVPVLTTFHTIKSSQASSLIECTLHTGKTHQIRASLAYLGHPIIGDGKYGKNEINKRFNEYKQRLHSYYLQFVNLKGNLTYLNSKAFTALPTWVKNKD